MVSIASLSVIVVTYQSSSILPTCLDALRRFCPEAEVLVVDNGSQDPTVAIAEAHPAVDHTLALPENPGYGTAANAGMRTASGELLAILNPDVTLSGPVFQEMVDAASGPDAFDLAAPWIENQAGDPVGSGYAASGPLKWLLQLSGGAALADSLRSGGLPSWLPHNLPGPLGVLTRGEHGRRAGTRAPADWLCGACLLMRREVFESLGGFDEGIFLYGEDEELCFRARQHGFRVEVLPAGPVTHARGAPENLSDPAILGRAQESMHRMIDRTNPGRPVRRWLMHRLLPAWLRRVGGRARPTRARSEGG